MRFLAPLLLISSLSAFAAAQDVEILKVVKNSAGAAVSYTVHTYKNGNLYGGKVFDAETGYLKCYDIAEISKEGKLIGTKIFAPDGEMLAKSLFIFDELGTVKETKFLLVNNVEVAETKLNTLIENRFNALMKPASAAPAQVAPAAPTSGKTVSTPP